MGRYSAPDKIFPCRRFHTGITRPRWRCAPLRRSHRADDWPRAAISPGRRSHTGKIPPGTTIHLWWRSRRDDRPVVSAASNPRPHRRPGPHPAPGRNPHPPIAPRDVPSSRIGYPPTAASPDTPSPDHNVESPSPRTWATTWVPSEPRNHLPPSHAKFRPDRVDHGIENPTVLADISASEPFLHFRRVTGPLHIESWRLSKITSQLS